MRGSWIPFHERIVEGPKKSISRGIRFVLLELALKSRATRGVFDFPVEWSTVEAVHDRLGGDRREIRKALELFTSSPNPEHNSLRIERDVSRHRLIVVRWEEYAGTHLSTGRVHEHRDNKRLASSETFHHGERETVGNALQDSTRHNSTGEDREGAASAAPAKPVREKGSKPGTRLPEGWSLSEQDVGFAAAKGWNREKATAEAEHFRSHHEANGTVSKSWAASWRTWVLQGLKFDQGRRVPASGTHPAARHQPIIQRGTEQPWLPKAKETA